MKLIDTLYINGKFNIEGNTQSTIAVKDGKVIDVGNETIINKYKEFAAEINDLQGGYVYPGFIETHMHLLETVSYNYYKVNLKDTYSKEEIEDRIKGFIKDKNIAAGEWVIGYGWNQENFSDGKLPDKNFLDEIASEHPILLFRACLHICVLNSKALDEAQISKNTICSKGGHIDLDNKGNITGILRENAIDLVTSVMPKLNNYKQIEELILTGCEAALKSGITTLHSDDFSFVDNRKLLLQVFLDLARHNKVPLKYVLQLKADSIEDIELYKKLGLKSWDRINNLIIGPIKIISDGSLGSRTAALNEAYTDDSSTDGIIIHSDKALKALITESFNNDFDVAVHCIGDKAMEKTMEILKGCYKLYKSKNFRPSIIHCQIANKTIVENMNKYEVIANVQPIFINTDWKIAKKRVGKNRMKYSYLLKSFIEGGVKLSFSSDAPVEDFNPLFGMYTAVERKDLNGEPKEGWHKDEAITLEEALNIYSVGNAYLSFDENSFGRIKIGNKSDFCVLSKELNDKTIKDIQLVRGIEVIKTVVNGNVVYNNALAEPAKTT